jgi:hypothetical protein
VCASLRMGAWEEGFGSSVLRVDLLLSRMDRLEKDARSEDDDELGLAQAVVRVDGVLVSSLRILSESDAARVDESAAENVGASRAGESTCVVSSGGQSQREPLCRSHEWAIRQRVARGDRLMQLLVNVSGVADGMHMLEVSLLPRSGAAAGAHMLNFWLASTRRCSQHRKVLTREPPPHPPRTPPVPPHTPFEPPPYPS